MSGASLSLDVLGEIEVAVSARLGHAKLPLAKAAAIAVGSVVALECSADAPVELLVNGVAIASGELVLDEDGILGVEIRHVAG